MTVYLAPIGVTTMIAVGIVAGNRPRLAVIRRLNREDLRQTTVQALIPGYDRAFVQLVLRMLQAGGVFAVTNGRGFTEKELLGMISDTLQHVRADYVMHKA